MPENSGSAAGIFAGGVLCPLPAPPSPRFALDAVQLIHGIDAFSPYTYFSFQALTSSSSTRKCAARSRGAQLAHSAYAANLVHETPRLYAIFDIR